MNKTYMKYKFCLPIVKKIRDNSTTSLRPLSLPKYPLDYDVAIIGGGIIGVAIGRELTKQSNTIKCILIEKENILGKHQSSHNSGVIHTGIYYKPGTLKARLASQSVDLILDYCKENNIPCKTYGKLVVAKDYTECDALRSLYEQAQKNQVPGIEMIWSKWDIKKIEPKCNGIEALWSPKTSNVDWGLVTESFAKEFRERGDVLVNNEVLSIEPSDDPNYPILIKTKAFNRIKTKYLIICAGLQAGTLSNKFGEKLNTNTYVSLKVDYELMSRQAISTNIYGIPDRELPFLGVHISPRPDGSVLLGPAAVPAYEIEGYRGEFNLDYFKNTIGSTNFQNMARRYFMMCLNQVRTMFSQDFRLKRLQELADIRAEDVRPGPTAIQGILIRKDGSFVDDFVFEFFEGEGIRKRIINCEFLPSPAATCSMSIAKLVAEKLFEIHPR